MLADFYIPRLSNDVTIAVQKNHLWGQILYKKHYVSLKFIFSEISKIENVNTKK